MDKVSFAALLAAIIMSGSPHLQASEALVQAKKILEAAKNDPKLKK